MKNQQVSESSDQIDSIGVTINGLQKEVHSMHLLDLREKEGIDPEQPGIAVALNDRLLRRAAWSETMIADRDRVEVITAMQGG